MTNGNLEFEVVPERCLRNDHIELHLGAPINQVLNALKNASKFIRNVELVYCQKEPFKRDITVLLKDDGIRLLFEPRSQILKLIEVFEFKNLTLRYCNNTFSTPEAPADVSRVENCFGATHPGVYDEKKKLYLLHWRGVSFSFPATEPSTVQSTYAHGLSSLNFSSMPLLDKMDIFTGLSPTEVKIPDVPTIVNCGNTFPIKITSIIHDDSLQGIKILMSGEEDDSDSRSSSNLPKFERDVLFGDSEASVLASLGAPSKVFYKSDEKMLIQRGSSNKKFGDGDHTDIFYNYFSLGLDILFDATTRCIIKLILHTNVPGHYDFGFYTQAPFEIEWPGSETRQKNKLLITTESKLSDFGNLFADKTTGVSKPVVLNRAPTNAGENPFGSTFCYGSDGLIIEVLDNGHIAALTMYETNYHKSDVSSDSDSNSQDE